MLIEFDVNENISAEQILVCERKISWKTLEP